MQQAVRAKRSEQVKLSRSEGPNQMRERRAAALHMGAALALCNCSPAAAAPRRARPQDRAARRRREASAGSAQAVHALGAPPCPLPAA
eukprot:273642-Chlamydomonas_euryale.AAC.1